MHPNDSGPIRVGSTWLNVSEFLGNETELTYELVHVDSGRVTFTGHNKTATTTDDITVTAGTRPGNCTITYHAVIEFEGAAKLATPIAKAAFEKLGNDTEKSLTDILQQPRFT